MNGHVSSILLGARDMDRSRRFYTDLGWEVRQDYGISVLFEPHGGSLVGFDGYVWDIGYNAQGKDQPYAE